jgi:hypothetical protein
MSNQEIIKLFEHIVRYGANEHLPELEKKQVNALLFPDKLYNENGKSPIDTLTTDLLRLTKKFLFIQWAENDTSEAMKELPVARFYRKFGLEERFWKSVEHMRSLFDENLYHDEFYFLDRYFVEEEVSTFKALFNSSEDEFAAIGKEYENPIYKNQIAGIRQLINSFEKLEGYDKRIETFQNSILDENERFTSYLTSQIEQHQKNLKKLNDFIPKNLSMETVVKVDEVLKVEDPVKINEPIKEIVTSADPCAEFKTLDFAK